MNRKQEFRETPPLDIFEIMTLVSSKWVTLSTFLSYFYTNDCSGVPNYKMFRLKLFLQGISRLWDLPTGPTTPSTHFLSVMGPVFVDLDLI